MNPDTDLDTGYRAMTREALADVDAGRVVDHQVVQTWANNLIPSDPHEREILDWIEQVADTDGWTGEDVGFARESVNTETQK